MSTVTEAIYTQGVMILLKESLDISELKKQLGGFRVLAQKEATDSWLSMGPSLVVEAERGSKGRVVIDLVDKRWPDTDSDPAVAAARKSGLFGPVEAEETLHRACAFCPSTWPEGPELANSHQAFLRLRVTYVKASGAPLDGVPEDYNATRECEQLLGVAEALLEHPSALCYFNPTGELIASKEFLAQVCEAFHKASQPAINALANRRMGKIEGSDWHLIDLVGMSQLDLPDFEIGFTEKYDPNEMAGLLVKLALQILKSGQTPKDGHTMSGPEGKLFEVRRFDRSCSKPEREVLRLRPRDGTVSPEVLGFGTKPVGRRGWWEFWKL